MSCIVYDCGCFRDTRTGETEFCAEHAGTEKLGGYAPGQPHHIPLPVQVRP